MPRSPPKQLKYNFHHFGPSWPEVHTAAERVAFLFQLKEV